MTAHGAEKKKEKEAKRAAVAAVVAQSPAGTTLY
jgi:hypothetical protein